MASGRFIYPFPTLKKFKREESLYKYSIALYSIFGLPSGRFIYIIDTETSILRRKSNGGKVTNEKKRPFFV